MFLKIFCQEMIKMQCQRCGKELGNSSRCSFCGFENVSTEGNVREMSRSENNFFNGVTIDAGGENTNSNLQKNYRGGQTFSSHTTFINFGGGGGFFSRLFEKFLRGLMNNSLLAKVIAGLIVVALAGIFFFVALPAMFFMLALGMALFLFARFTGKI